MAGGRERIFFYGTLRRGGSREASRFYPGAVFLRAARVRGVLHGFGDYPGLRLAAEAGWVAGELFEVPPDVLAKLDDWEGIDPVAPHEGEYRRVRLQAELDDGTEEECWGYEIAPERCAGRPVIAGGDWIAHAASRGAL